MFWEFLEHPVICYQSFGTRYRAQKDHLNIVLLYFSIHHINQVMGPFSKLRKRKNSLKLVLNGVWKVSTILQLLSVQYK